ncbi:MAG: ABC transporter ATP-binding protein [Deltaproteobacteria bacterium]|nr:ABC transporter ATP-binding protein [Deltaproteobacteria bacterium]
METILRLENVSKRFQNLQVLKDYNLEMNTGEFLTLLGPSGCGKTTTLNLVAGFLQPDSGTIYLRGEPVNNVASRKRNLSMVFQTWALFPHMTAYENVAFGLRMRGKTRSEIDKKVREMLKLVRLPDVAEKYPSQLSGGMRQRLALARALAVEPSILLLDEPLSNLDAALRKEMQVELKRIHDELKVTTLFVTHNQEEALVMSDRIAVMKDGKIVRMDSPRKLYNDPRSRFVCQFMGDVNLFEGRVQQISTASAVVESGGMKLKVPVKEGLQVGKKITVAVRPETISVNRTPSASAENSLRAVVKQLIFNGNNIQYYLDTADRELLALDYQKTLSKLPEKGDTVFAEFDAESFMFLEED